MASTTWKGHLVFGLVSIPVKLSRAARAEKVSFRQLHRTWEPAPKREIPQMLPAIGKKAGPSLEPVPMPVVEKVARVHERIVSDADETETPVDRTQVVKGYEYQKDQYVVIEKDELKALAPEADRNMEITEFVKLAEIDPVYFESSYYVVPENAGVKAYSLLYEALRQAGYVGIASLVMNRREHIVVVRPGRRGILLHTMFYNNEIRSEDEYAADTNLVIGKELEMGKMLIEAMAAPFQPEKFRDTYKEKLEALIQGKVEGREAVPAVAPKKEPVPDILKALQNSLQIARKPAASARVSKLPQNQRRKRG
jgi:DNA end-binding protein Ku